MTKRLICAASAFAIWTVGYPALAQQVEAKGEASATLGASASGNAAGETNASAGTATAAPASTPAAGAAAPLATESDHDAMVGRLAIGYLGYTRIGYGAMANNETNEATAAPGAPAVAPIIGVRYWLDPMLGIDAGLGLTTTFGTHDAAGAKTDAAAPTGLAVHFGVPLALRAAKHYAFEIIPEMNFAYASHGAGPVDYSGMHIDVGARAGAEIHFGFIGIPELSLVGSLGLRMDIESTKTETDNGAGGTITNKDSRWFLHTTVNDSPWNIFIGNVSAFYYL